MRGLSAEYVAAVAAIDEANRADPQSVAVRGSVRPLALVHGELAAEWVEKLSPDADETVLLAARAHHLRRWEVPRSSAADDRAGYLQWRKEQKTRHGDDVAEILLAAGYDGGAIGRVQSILRRDRLKTDAEQQIVEDAACLVFIETQLSSMVHRLEREHLLDVIRKTARKMSPEGLAAVPGIELDDVAKALLAAALG